MTYTATDGNGVSTNKTFTITVVNGPNVPTSAPSSVYAAQDSSGRDAAGVFWDAVEGATEYVGQVRTADGSYPDKPDNSTPEGVWLNVQSAVRNAAILYLTDGDYKVRVAARNADGVGPWSAEASFTVRVGGV